MILELVEEAKEARTGIWCGVLVTERAAGQLCVMRCVGRVLRHKIMRPMNACSGFYFIFVSSHVTRPREGRHDSFKATGGVASHGFLKRS
jgi:hypothetical protein